MKTISIQLRGDPASEKELAEKIVSIIGEIVTSSGIAVKGKITEVVATTSTVTVERVTKSLAGPNLDPVVKIAAEKPSLK